MTARLTLATVRWDSVAGATGWEIRKDGRKVATAGAKARTTQVSVDDATVVEIVDLPARKTVQALELSQVTR